MGLKKQTVPGGVARFASARKLCEQPLVIAAAAAENLRNHGGVEDVSQAGEERDDRRTIVVGC